MGCGFTSIQMSPSLMKVGNEAFCGNYQLIWCSISCSINVESFGTGLKGRQFRACPYLQYIDLTPIGDTLPEVLADLSGYEHVMFSKDEVVPTGYISISPNAG